MAIYGPGTPIKIGQENIWHGTDRTNGRDMRSVDGRVPGMALGYSRCDITAANPLFMDGVVPYGNGLWRDLDQLDTAPGAVMAQKPANGKFVGILELNLGWQTGHPVQNWGVPTYARSDMITKGFIMYKQAMAAVGQEANYINMLKGDRTQDVATVRSTYDDWIAAWKAAGDGARLGLFFANTSGIPVVSAVAAADVANPTLAGCTFAAFEYLMEPENKAVFFNLGW